MLTCMFLFVTHMISWLSIPKLTKRAVVWTPYAILLSYISDCNSKLSDELTHSLGTVYILYIFSKISLFVSDDGHISTG